MIETLSGFAANVVAFSGHGRLSRADYETVLIPAIEAGFAKHDKLRLYYEIGADFAGLEAGAVLDDFKVGMAHLLRWERIAVVTDVDWIRHAICAFAFVMPGSVKVYRLPDASEARRWISSKA